MGNRRWTGTVMRGVRVGMIVLAPMFMVALVFSEWDKVQAAQWNFRADLLGLSLFGAVIIFFLDAYGWHLILKALGHELPASRTIKVWLVSSLSRYVPGGIWSYATRIALAEAEGVGIATASLSLYLETLLLATSSLAIGLLVLGWGVGLPIDPLSIAIIAVLSGLLLHPRALAWLGRMPGRVGAAMQSVRLPGARRTIGLYFYYLVFWVLFGAMYVCFVGAVHPVSYHYWAPIGSGFALAFFAGFVVVFAPSGIGVRESALYLLLLPFMPPAASLVVSIGSRLWLMAAEGIALFIILLYGRLSARMEI